MFVCFALHSFFLPACHLGGLWTPKKDGRGGKPYFMKIKLTSLLNCGCNIIKIFQRLSSQSIWQEGILVHHLHGYFVRIQLNDVSMHAEALY